MLEDCNNQTVLIDALFFLKFYKYETSTEFRLCVGVKL